MADGNFMVHGRVINGLEARQMSLEDAIGAGHVVTRCPRCRHLESTDVSWWRRSRTDSQSTLGLLSRRLRCLCGSPVVVLEVWPVVPPPTEAAPRTFHWRA